MAKEKEKKLEELFVEAEELIKELESPELPLEEAFVKYEEGMKLIKACNEKIDVIEKKMQVINSEGEAEDFS